MKTLHTLLIVCIAGTLAVGLSSCEKENFDNPETPNLPYALSLGITSSGVTTYYVVTADNLMSGTINAVGKGLEQNGYRDYEQGGKTIFSIGGLGVTSATGIVRDNAGYLIEKGDFVFNNSLNAFTQIDPQTMLGIELPSNKESGDKITFYTVDINSISITNKTTHTPIAAMSLPEWPSITGMCRSEDNIYVTYFPMSPTTYQTPFTDTTYVAVFSYPDMNLKTIMKDTRTGPAGSWGAFNGMIQVESGDMYIMSSSALSNGYSQSTKNAAFLRIPKGTTEFDDYYFDFETATGGLKPAHIKYIGNGLVFAEVSTINPQTAADRWGDKSLKCSIIDLNNKTVTDVPQIPVHNGNGGRRFTALVDGGYVYCPITTSEGTYIYRVDPQTATAEKGAKVATTFVGGFFRINN
ncbi:MAG: DUF4374 domain-containing protein [Bacteroidales bacterium]